MTPHESSGLACLLVFVSCFALSWVVAKWVRSRITRLEKPLAALQAPLLPLVYVLVLVPMLMQLEVGYSGKD